MFNFFDEIHPHLPEVPDSLYGEPEALREYLRARWLITATTMLEEARIQRHLTQCELAERLKTKQSVISRTESDFSGSITLRRFIDWLLACEMVPEEIVSHPWETIYQAIELQQLHGTINSPSFWESTNSFSFWTQKSEIDVLTEPLNQDQAPLHTEMVYKAQGGNDAA